jgi:hypothetical protein
MSYLITSEVIFMTYKALINYLFYAFNQNFSVAWDFHLLSAHTYDQPVTWKFIVASDAPNSNPAHKLCFLTFRRCKLFTFNPFCLVITSFIYVLFRANLVH